MAKLVLHLPESGGGVGQDVNTVETHGPHVPAHVEEGDGAGPALRRVQPVAGPGILTDIRFAPVPDIEAVDGVVGNGQPDEKKFQKEDERQSAEKANVFVISINAVGRKRIEEKMLNHKV